MRNFYPAVNEDTLLESLVDSYIYESLIENFLHVTVLNVKYGKPIIYRKTFEKSELLDGMKFNADKYFYSHYDKNFSSFVNSPVEEVFHCLFSFYGKKAMNFVSGKNMYLPEWMQSVKDSNIDFSEADVLDRLYKNRIIVK